MTNDDYTLDELMTACIARQIHDGEVVAQGLATPLVAAGYILAKTTHAPNIYFASAIGQGICADWAPLGIATIEGFWLDKAITTFGFGRIAAELLPSFAPKEFFRPAQVDSRGNFNNIAFGKDYAKPRMRLPGTGGIPDVSTYATHTHLYVPRHSRLTFTEPIDFISGLGHMPQRTHGTGPVYLITDLGQFDWANGVMRLATIHPGVELATVQRKTGFELEISPDLHETPIPTAEDLRLLREEIDPLGVRRLELLGGTARKDAVREILEKEGAL